MNILLIIKNFDFGGAENHVTVLANRLTQEGHKVLVVSRFGLQIQFLNPKIIHVSLDIQDINIPFHVVRLTRLIREEKIEIIHAHQRIAILLACLLGKLTTVPVVATVHGRIRYDLRSDFVRKNICKLITVSENSLRGANANPHLKNKTTLIVNGINIPLKQNIPKPGCFPILYYASRFDKRHSGFIEMLIDKIWPRIVKLNPEINLSLSGDGPGLKHILTKAEIFNAKYRTNKIIYNGFRPNALVGIQNASLVLGVGRIAIESLAAGVPVLSVNAKHCGEIITNSNYKKFKFGNFVAIENPPPEPEKVISEINKFLNNPHYYQNETQKLQAMVQTEFDSVKTTNQTIALYRELNKENC